jgi:hypothetical protein
VVDVQNDFCPGGALAVPDGDQVVPVLNEYNCAIRKRRPTDLCFSRIGIPPTPSIFAEPADHGLRIVCRIHREPRSTPRCVSGRHGSHHQGHEALRITGIRLLMALMRKGRPLAEVLRGGGSRRAVS